MHDYRIVLGHVTSKKFTKGRLTLHVYLNLHLNNIQAKVRAQNADRAIIHWNTI